MSGKTIGEQAEIIGAAFQNIITKKFGSRIAPEPIIFSTGIKHLDALLGGGIVSSGPVMVTSTPETGKSTFCYQMAKQLHDTHENSITVYLDLEGSGGSVNSNESRISRMDTFGLSNSPRFSYQPIVLDLMELFELINELIQAKKISEKQTGREFLLFIIWDSISSTPSSKTGEAADPNKIIGLKGRQLSFLLEKYLPLFKFNRVFLLTVDQVRADISIDGPFKQKEQSVGMFKDMKTASNIFALQHNIQQWLFFSRTKTITSDSHYGIDGWLVNVLIEKNKLAPSKNYVTCVFDKYKGFDKFWSEFLFISEMTYLEKKTLKKPEKLPFPLMIKTTGNRSTLVVIDTEGKQLYKSEPFFKKTAKELYETNVEFKTWFDFAVDISSYERITNGMFKMSERNQAIADMSETQDQISELTAENETNIELETNLNSEQYDIPTNDSPPEDLNDTDIDQQIYKETLAKEEDSLILESPPVPPEEQYNSVF